jgi:transcriptional regulator with GAF, ATPase, and Fis domain
MYDCSFPEHPVSPGDTLTFRLHFRVHRRKSRFHLTGRQQENELVPKTIEENQREHIITVLRQCKGRVAGYGGAAEFLGVPPSTLSSKLKRLGIQKAHYFASC